MKSKIKYIEPPMKWNPGLNKYEVDLPIVRKRGKKTLEKPKTSFARIILFIIIISLITSLGAWIISMLF